MGFLWFKSKAEKQKEEEYRKKRELEREQVKNNFEKLKTEFPVGSIIYYLGQKMTVVYVKCLYERWIEIYTEWFTSIGEHKSMIITQSKFQFIKKES